MASVHLFIDNLNMGGFQRLCIDQSYSFAERGYKVQIHCLTRVPDENSNSFIHLERERIVQMDIAISTISSDHFNQFKNTLKVLKSLQNNDLVISHSLRATVVIWIARLFVRSDRPFITSIHQLPSLSAPFQRTKRFHYAQMSPVLSAYSLAVKHDWESRLSKSLYFNLFLRKKIEVLRNGIFLDRLPTYVEKMISERSSRLVYLGRNTGWKGIETLLKFAGMDSLLSFKILLILPEIDKVWEKELRDRFGSRIELVIGKTLSSYAPRAGDVHFYAVQYGPRAKFIESISLNCLEMASLGVPSLVTQGGLGTWPDLAETNIFVECDWRDFDETCKKILHASELEFAPTAIKRIRDLVDIQNNVSKIISILDRSS